MLEAIVILLGAGAISAIGGKIGGDAYDAGKDLWNTYQAQKREMSQQPQQQAPTQQPPTPTPQQPAAPQQQVGALKKAWWYNV